MALIRRVARFLKRRLSFHSADPTVRRPTLPEADYQFGNIVVVDVTGGLCNQLMCYAAARRLSIRKGGCPVIAFSNAFTASNHTRWSLDAYPTRIAIATDSTQLREAVMKKVDYLPSLAHERLFEHDGHCIAPADFQRLEETIANRRISFTNFNVALYHFRSDLDEYRPTRQVLSELQYPINLLTAYGRDVMQKITNSRESVAVHIRRGDFLGPGNDLAVKPEYYLRACELLRSRLARPQFFAFSDDFSWCKSLFSKFSDVDVVDDRGLGSAGEDLFLGSRCQHFVLTNHSTFSHWMVELADDYAARMILTNSLTDVITTRAIPFYYTPARCEAVPS
jgi:hypothetical protein